VLPFCRADRRGFSHEGVCPRTWESLLQAVVIPCVRAPASCARRLHVPKTVPHATVGFCGQDDLLVHGMQSILVKFMKDSVVRGRLLHLLYERRSEGPIPFGHAEQAIPPPGGINRRDWLRALAQLSEYRLIDWTPLAERRGMGLLTGFAKINDLGVKVLEAGVAPPISISIDKSQRTSVPRQPQAPIGETTPQQQVITKALEKVITAINQADLSEQEKNEAKSLLGKLLGSKAAASVLGAGTQSLAAKYFAG
jgi:hypothetical protein